MRRAGLALIVVAVAVALGVGSLQFADTPKPALPPSGNVAGPTFPPEIEALHPTDLGNMAIHSGVLQTLDDQKVCLQPRGPNTCYPLNSDSVVEPGLEVGESVAIYRIIDGRVVSVRAEN